MEYRLVRTAEGHYLEVTVTGPISLDRLREGFGSMAPLWEAMNSLPALWDLTGAELSDVDLTQMRELREFIRGQLAPAGPRAAILVRDPGDRLLLNLWVEQLAMLSVHQRRVFLDCDEALVWLRAP